MKFKTPGWDTTRNPTVVNLSYSILRAIKELVEWKYGILGNYNLSDYLSGIILNLFSQAGKYNYMYKGLKNKPEFRTFRLEPCPGIFVCV